MGEKQAKLIVCRGLSQGNREDLSAHWDDATMRGSGGAESVGIPAGQLRLITSCHSFHVCSLSSWAFIGTVFHGVSKLQGWHLAGREAEADTAVMEAERLHRAKPAPQSSTQAPILPCHQPQVQH